MSEAISEHLRALKIASVAAREAFEAHHYTGDASDLDARIAFDIEEQKLLRASTKARMAYTDALAAHLASEAA